MNEKISRLITNISLIGSLIFVGIQIKQNTMIAKSQIMAMEAEISQNYYLSIIDAELLTNAYTKMYANIELNPNEIRQLNWHSYANFSSSNFKYWQYKNGMIDESEWMRKKKSIKWQFEVNQAYREAWTKMKFNFDTEFIEEFEKTVNDNSITLKLE